MQVDYQYALEYDICSFFFLFFIACRFFFFKNFKSTRTYVFGYIIISAIIVTLLDMLGSHMINNIYDYPVWLNFLVNNVFYLFQAVSPALVLIYALIYTGWDENKKLSLAFLIPCFLTFFVQFINPVFHLTFDIITDEAGHIFFEKGSLSLMVYFNSAYCFFMVLILTIFNKSKITFSQRIVMYLVVLLIIITSIFQLFNPNVLLTCTGSAICITLMMFTLQNPDDLIDIVSGSFNYTAAVVYLENLLRRKIKQNIIIVDVHGIGNINKSVNLNAGNYIVNSSARYLRSIDRKGFVFRISNSVYLVCLDESHNMEDVAYQIKDRFTRTWSFNEFKFMLDVRISYFPLSNSFKRGMDVLNFIHMVNNVRSTDSFNTITEVGEEFKNALQRRIHIEEELKESLKDGKGFYLNYQPVIDVHTNIYNHAEALLRFESATLGKVSPAEFIPIAEDIGLIGKIDLFVLKTACEFLNKNDSISLLDINLSGSEFYRNPSKDIINIVKDYGVDPSRLCFEITETAAAKYPDNLIKCMNELRELGFLFALDDFGVGYSNINQAISLPFSIIKIDKSLLSEDNKTRKFLGVIIQTFKTINLPIIVEGVETKEQSDLVKALGADYIQGYYYSIPLDESKMTAFLKQKE